MHIPLDKANKFIYLNADGNEIPRNAFDTHHVFPRNYAKGNGEKGWIDLFKVPIVKTCHNLGKGSLHANVELCPLPDKDMQYRMRLQSYQDDATSPYDRFINMSEQVHDIAQTSHDRRTVWLAERIADNLERQAPYILQGMVEVIEL